MSASVLSASDTKGSESDIDRLRWGEDAREWKEGGGDAGMA